MTDPYAINPGPPPPVARPAASLAAVLVLVLVFFVGLAVGQSGILSPASTPSTPVAVVPTPGIPTGPLPSMPANAPANFDLFWQALDTIRQNYVGRADLTDQQITYGAIKGMVDALGDTAHSVFLTPEAVQAENESLNGSVVGIGVLLGQKDDQIVVISVIPDSPASKAGIRTGDAIVSVDGTSTSGLAPEEVAPKVRGEAGTPVQLQLQRPSTGETLDLSVVREELHFPRCRGRWFPAPTPPCCAWSSSRQAPRPSSGRLAMRQLPRARRRSSWISAATPVATSARRWTARASSWTTRPSTFASWPTDSASRSRRTTKFPPPTRHWSS
jgi:membrane-associated protease RseP (regulator of RpoE activity)